MEIASVLGIHAMTTATRILAEEVALAQGRQLSAGVFTRVCAASSVWVQAEA